MTRGRPGETEQERADRNLGDLLQELRVAQTGVQILFAFLLTLPLQARFSTLTALDRALVVADLMAVAVATVCLIAPVAYHRVLFRHQLKDEIVTATDRLARAGLAFLGTAVTLSVALTLDLLVHGWAWVGAGFVAVLVVVLWWALPLRRRRTADPLPDPEQARGGARVQDDQARDQGADRDPNRDQDRDRDHDRPDHDRPDHDRDPDSGEPRR